MKHHKKESFIHNHHALSIKHLKLHFNC